MYASSCFDNAVRLAAYEQHNDPDGEYYVVAGHNRYGIHYGVLEVREYGETLTDFDSPFADGVEKKITIEQAKEVRKRLIEKDQTRISLADLPMPHNHQDRMVALAPEIDMLNELLEEIKN